MGIEGVTTRKNEKNCEEQYCCCKDFMNSKSGRRITEQSSSYTDDKYCCVVDGFGYPVLDNILYCPYCGSKLVGC